MNYNNWRDAVVGLITGTEFLTYFGVEGDLSGNAGCNRYFASFTVSDGSIEIGCQAQLCASARNRASWSRKANFWPP
ncbi:MAG: META domain-containing protein [Chloroflexi bacterium]|nr:META domain-containing protein [Chloroflexota bacterium]